MGEGAARAASSVGEYLDRSGEGKTLNKDTNAIFHSTYMPLCILLYFYEFLYIFYVVHMCCSIFHSVFCFVSISIAYSILCSIFNSAGVSSCAEQQLQWCLLFWTCWDQLWLLFWSRRSLDTSTYISNVHKPQWKSLNEKKASNSLLWSQMEKVWHFWVGFDKLCSCESILVTHWHNPDASKPSILCLGDSRKINEQ